MLRSCSFFVFVWQPQRKAQHVSKINVKVVQLLHLFPWQPQRTTQQLWTIDIKVVQFLHIFLTTSKETPTSLSKWFQGSAVFPTTSKDNPSFSWCQGSAISSDYFLTASKTTRQVSTTDGKVVQFRHFSPDNLKVSPNNCEQLTSR